MLVAFEKHGCLKVVDCDEMWYDDATKVHSGPTSDARSTPKRAAEPFCVLKDRESSSEAAQKEASRTTHVVDKHRPHDQSGQNHACCADVAHPRMLKLTKIPCSKRADAFGQSWDFNQDVPLVAFSDGGQGDASCDGEPDNTTQHKKGRQRPCRGKRLQFQRYVEKMKLEIENDPSGFNVHKAELPASIATVDKFRGKFVHILSALQHDILEGLADPSRDAGTNLGGFGYSGMISLD